MHAAWGEGRRDVEIVHLGCACAAGWYGAGRCGAAR